MRVALAIAATFLAASPALADEIYCRDGAALDWVEGKIIDTVEDDFVPVVFSVDLETGKVDEHRVGSRAWITGGGQLTILSPPDDTGHSDFVALDQRNGSTLRIATGLVGRPFIRISRDGEVGYGRCDLTDLMELDQ